MEVSPMQAGTITVEEAGKVLGICRNAAYAAAKAGELPTIRIGRRILVPKVAFERMLENAGQKPATTEVA
jgi:excisionase family DNA binding protein